MTAQLAIDALSVDVRAGREPVRLLDGVRLDVRAGETVCLVGESGSGKTVTALSVLRLVDHGGGTIAQGEIRFNGRNLAQLSERAMSALRGRRIGLIFQEPSTAFDPLFTIGEQIVETLLRHRGIGRAAARRRAMALLERVRIDRARHRFHQYPHQLSGGMRQRAMIAMALACDPALLIADEPTTALDVTTQAQILKLLTDIQADSGMSLLLITHDLGIAAAMADRVVVMYAGRVVEDAPADEIFRHPRHPYTSGLLASVIDQGTVGGRLRAIEGAVPDPRRPASGCRFHPRCERADSNCAFQAPLLERRAGAAVACWHPHEKPAEARAIVVEAPPARLAAAPREPLVQASGLGKSYRLGTDLPFAHGAVVHAVADVSFDIGKGETFGLVGESGSGKSTLGRLLLRLEKPSSGQVWFDGADLGRLNAGQLRMARRRMQMIFQDATGSLDSRWPVGRSIAEPLMVHESLSADARRERVRSLLDQVGLDPDWSGRLPEQLSGGQRQRVAIARAIALNPKFIVADEAVSALDVSVRAQILNLLDDIKARLGLTYLFIGHELNLVRHVADRIGVMYLGRIVETGSARSVFAHPAHHYTRALLAAVPSVDPARRGWFRTMDDMAAIPDTAAGCPFHVRCPAATERCRSERPKLDARAADHAVACHHPA